LVIVSFVLSACLSLVDVTSRPAMRKDTRAALDDVANPFPIRYVTGASLHGIGGRMSIGLPATLM